MTTQGLRKSTPKQLANWQLFGGGSTQINPEFIGLQSSFGMPAITQFPEFHGFCVENWYEISRRAIFIGCTKRAFYPHINDLDPPCLFIACT